MNQEQRQQIKRFLDIFIRRKVIIISCILVSMVIGVGKYLNTPKLFRSTSLIMYQQKINPTEMSPDMLRFQETINTVSQQINSRTSLESLINQFNLYQDLRSRLPMEDVVDFMRRRDVKIEPDRRGNTFQVSYQGPVPRTVLLVTNALAAKFIEENIRYREETVSEASAYIKDELSMAKEALNKKDSAMRDYKLQYYNEMPSQLEANISRLNALQAQYQSYQNNLQDFQRTKVMIQEQISLRKDLLTQLENNSGSMQVDQASLPIERQLASLNYQLDNLLTKYTDKHPDVKRMKSLIAQLEADQKAESIVDPETGLPNMEAQDFQLVKMMQQLDDIDYNMVRIKKETETIQENIIKYKKWIEAAPVREAEWTDLIRDYKQFTDHYEALVARNIQAGSAQSLERRQKGSQFKIVDPAHFPETPFQPDFKKIMLMVLALGMGVGGAISFGLEFLDTSFRDAHDLEKFLKIPVACSIPVIKTNAEIRKYRIKSVVWISLLIFSLGIIGGGVVYLWFKGSIII